MFRIQSKNLALKDTCKLFSFLILESEWNFRIRLQCRDSVHKLWHAIEFVVSFLLKLDHYEHFHHHSLFTQWWFCLFVFVFDAYELSWKDVCSFKTWKLLSHRLNFILPKGSLQADKAVKQSKTVSISHMQLWWLRTTIMTSMSRHS